jgi:hypothetical protein
MSEEILNDYRVLSTPVVYQGVTHDPGSIIRITDTEANNIGLNYLEKIQPEAETDTQDEASQNDSESGEQTNSESTSENSANADITENQNESSQVGDQTQTSDNNQ